MDRDWMFERLNVIPFEKLRLKIRDGLLRILRMVKMNMADYVSRISIWIIIIHESDLFIRNLIIELSIALRNLLRIVLHIPI